MIKICLEVGNDAGRRRVLVQAESIRAAVDVVEECYPGSAARVIFPISPEAFFVDKTGAETGLSEPGDAGSDEAGVIWVSSTKRQVSAQHDSLV
jgi:hypothetical protein